MLLVVLEATGERALGIKVGSLVGPTDFCDLVLFPLEDFITLADLVLLPEMEVGKSVGK